MFPKEFIPFICMKKIINGTILCNISKPFSPYDHKTEDRNKWVFNRYRTLFPYKPDPMPSFFRHTFRSRIQKQEMKNNHNSTIFWTKNKIRVIFIWDKLLEFLLLNEVLKNLIFFSLTNQKSWLYNTNNEQISNSKNLFVINV